MIVMNDRTKSLILGMDFLEAFGIGTKVISDMMIPNPLSENKNYKPAHRVETTNLETMIIELVKTELSRNIRTKDTKSEKVTEVFESDNMLDDGIEFTPITATQFIELSRVLGNKCY